MSDTADASKTLACRFASLPSRLRTEVAKRLLVWHDEARDRRPLGREGKDFLELFWDEVERARGATLAARNPFSAEGNKTRS